MQEHKSQAFDRMFFFSAYTITKKVLCFSETYQKKKIRIADGSVVCLY